jgi:transposase
VAKGFRPVLRDQPMLLPVDMREWLPEDHLAWFVLETVDVLDTSGLERCRRVGAAGRAGYDPRMLFALLVYAYCLGVRSSRAVERLCTTDVAFRVLCAQDPPDHTTIARFRAEAGPAFAGLFTQVLLVAARAGWPGSARSRSTGRRSPRTPRSTPIGVVTGWRSRSRRW